MEAEGLSGLAVEAPTRMFHSQTRQSQAQETSDTAVLAYYISSGQEPQVGFPRPTLKMRDLFYKDEATRQTLCWACSKQNHISLQPPHKTHTHAHAHSHTYSFSHTMLYTLTLIYTHFTHIHTYTLIHTLLSHSHTHSGIYTLTYSHTFRCTQLQIVPLPSPNIFKPLHTVSQALHLRELSAE